MQAERGAPGWREAEVPFSGGGGSVEGALSRDSDGFVGVDSVVDGGLEAAEDWLERALCCFPDDEVWFS